MNEEDIRKIVRDEMKRNYQSGTPQIDPHSHNGVDNLKVDIANLQGYIPIPTTNSIITGAGNSLGISAASIGSGGSGYSIGQEVTVNGGLGGVVQITNVSGGVVTAFSILKRGQLYTVGVQTTTASPGTGFTVNITSVTGNGSYPFGSAKALQVPSLEIVNPDMGIFPIPVITDNTASYAFKGGYAPEGTMIGYYDAVNSIYILFVRMFGAWRGIQLTENIYDYFI